MAVRVVPGVGAMLVSSNIRVGQERIEGLCELKTLQNFPSAIICLLSFLSDAIDSLNTPDAPARKGFLFSSLLIMWSVKALNNDHCCLVLFIHSMCLEDVSFGANLKLKGQNSKIHLHATEQLRHEDINNKKN